MSLAQYKFNFNFISTKLGVGEGKMKADYEVKNQPLNKMKSENLDSQPVYTLQEMSLIKFL